MPRELCDSFKVFRANLSRSEAFLRIFDKGRGPGQPSNDEKELLRGAVIFAIGALDSFLHDLVLELVPRFGGNREGMKEALRQIAKDDPSLPLRVALADDGRAEFAEALDSWLEAKSFQGPEAITRALAYVGSPISWADFDTATGVDAAERLTHYTEMRHNIVHRGQRPFVKRNQAGECIELVRALGERINSEAVRFYADEARKP